MLVLGHALMLAAPAARAQDQASVRTFLSGIYRHYLPGSSDKGSLILRPKRMFEPGLADAMIRDFRAAARRRDAPTLDGDPFCDCQDYDGFVAKIASVNVSRGRARAVVRFTNDKPVALTYDLVWTPAGWKIRDILWAEGSLRRLYFKRG